LVGWGLIISNIIFFVPIISLHLVYACIGIHLTQCRSMLEQQSNMKKINNDPRNKQVAVQGNI
jgi:hypothetical protein